jgi:mRNA-degrading endonuclease RelE of RelBE toxin-antitoxin system
MSARVLFAPEAQADFDALPKRMQPRVRDVLERLTRWPDVSGVKWLRGTWAGTGRLRAGDWRVLFRLVSPTVIVVRIQHRSQVYEE